jgi:Ice-binding-like/Bacterial Ig-like domain
MGTIPPDRPGVFLRVVDKGDKQIRNLNLAVTKLLIGFFEKPLRGRYTSVSSKKAPGNGVGVRNCTDARFVPIYTLTPLGFVFLSLPPIFTRKGSVIRIYWRSTEEWRNEMSVNMKQSPVWKNGTANRRSLGLGMAVLLAVFLAGCGATTKPTLSAMAPSSGIQGVAVAVTLTGTNFAAGSTISLSGTGITVSNLTVASSTSITATFTIAVSAPAGAQNVTVTSSGKTSGSQAFTVSSGAPTLTSVSPSSGTQGQIVNVTLTGTLFTAGSTIALGGTGFVISNTTVVSSTSITATFAIALNAPAGAQNISVTNSSGTSATQTFTVNALPPTVTLTNPANVATSIPINRKIVATFSKPMDPTTITTATFTLASTSNIAGTVTYNATTNMATFAPTASLAANTTFTATITTGAKDLSGTSLASSFVWTFATGATADTTAPTVSSTNPANIATAVPLNQKIAATFSKVMDAATITATTFTVKQGTTSVAGTVGYAGTIATFTPTANLTASTVYTVTITTGAADLAGNALASNFVWTFTTGTASNASAPTVTSTVPLNVATGVNINQTINATFSTAMDPRTISTLTFTLAGPGTTSVTGTVTCNSGCTIATFTPTANLTASAQFTATVTTGATDLSGNALAANKVWTFMTGTTTGPGPISLGAAGTFAATGGSAGETNQGINTVIDGDIATTGASTKVTGFHDTTIPYNPPSGCIYTETTLNVGVVNGTIYTATPPPTVTCPNEGTASTFSIATQALADAQKAYNTLAGLPGGPDPGAQLGALTLAPAVYKTAGGSFMITGTDLTLDAKGDANAVWVFQMASTLTVGAPGAPRSVILINGAQAKNVYWQVGSSATINAAGGGTMVGTIIASAGISFSTAGNVAITTLNGRAMALNASVTMVNTVINVPLP